jgi:hypothetical protein
LAREALSSSVLRCPAVRMARRRRSAPCFAGDSTGGRRRRFDANPDETLSMVVDPNGQDRQAIWLGERMADARGIERAEGLGLVPFARGCSPAAFSYAVGSVESIPDRRNIASNSDHSGLGTTQALNRSSQRAVARRAAAQRAVRDTAPLPSAPSPLAQPSRPPQ